MKQIDVPRVALTVQEASKALGINLTYMYDLVRQEDFPSFKIGSRFFVSLKGLEDWVAKQAGCLEKGGSNA